MLIIKNINISHHEGCRPAAACAPWSVPEAFSVTPGTGCSHHGLGRGYATASREMWALGASAVPELWLQASPRGETEPPEWRGSSPATSLICSSWTTF